MQSCKNHETTLVLDRLWRSRSSPLSPHLSDWSRCVSSACVFPSNWTHSFGTPFKFLLRMLLAFCYPRPPLLLLVVSDMACSLVMSPGLFIGEYLHVFFPVLLGRKHLCCCLTHCFIIMADSSEQNHTAKYSLAFDTYIISFRIYLCFFTKNGSDTKCI